LRRPKSTGIYAQTVSPHIAETRVVPEKVVYSGHVDEWSDID